MAAVNLVIRSSESPPPPGLIGLIGLLFNIISCLSQNSDRNFIHINLKENLFSVISLNFNWVVL